MGNENPGAQNLAPPTPNDGDFGMNDDDFYVDPNTGAVFIGETNVEGRGRRPQADPTSLLQAPNLPPPPQPDDENFGLTNEDIKMDEHGNVDIGNIRVQQEGINNEDPIQDEFDRNKMTADEREAQALAEEEKYQKEQGKKQPPPPEKKEWRLTLADEEKVINDENELLNLANKGLRADYKLREVAEMRKEIEPFYQISLRLKDDPAFVQHVKNYGQPNYEIEGPEPVQVAPDQFQKLVDERVTDQMRAQRIYWSHDKKYENFKEYPKADEVRQKLLADSLHWDKFTRDWVDKNPVAYADKFNQTVQKLIRERNLDPEPAIPIPPRIIEKQKAVLESLRAKEVAKQKAKVESARSTADVQAADGRIALNRARKRASETGSVADWAEVIEKMGFAD